MLTRSDKVKQGLFLDLVAALVFVVAASGLHLR